MARFKKMMIARAAPAAADHEAGDAAAAGASAKAVFCGGSGGG
ncbi:hypothetical protein [Mycolicibacterium komossense]|nr:hypothetical protein [Mycolicibacterium komossense]